MKKSRRLLPKLRKISKKNKKHHYKLKDRHNKRILAINEGVRYEMKYKKRTRKKAAIAKKARINILRIYRKNKNKKDCEKITRDMRYMDKRYKLGKTQNICRKRRMRKKRKTQKGGKKKKKALSKNKYKRAYQIEERLRRTRQNTGQISTHQPPRHLDVVADTGSTKYSSPMTGPSAGTGGTSMTGGKKRWRTRRKKL